MPDCARWSPMRSVNRHVALLFHMGERFVNRELAETGITSGTAPLLLELRDGGDRNPTGLAVAAGVGKAHVTRSLQTLKRAGYVVVAREPSDGRMLTVSLTEEGRAVAAKAEDAMRAWFDLVSSGIAPDDLDAVDAVLNAFYANAVRHFAASSSPSGASPDLP